MSQDAPSSKPKGLLGRVPTMVVWAAVGAVAAVVIVAAGVGMVAASRPTFFNRYASLRRSYSELQTSAHKGMSCGQCHVDKRGPLVYEAALIGDYYGSLIGKPKDAPAFVRFDPPTSAACLTCHLYDWSMDSRKTMKIPHPAHLRVASETRDCVTCHRWIGHEETYMQKHQAMPFSTVCASFPCHVGTKPAQDCQNCHHILQADKGPWKLIHPQTVRAYGPNACLEQCHTADQCRECHTTGKTPVFAAQPVQAGVSAIEKQHVLPDWISKHGAMALQDQSKCLICHVSEGECQDCHAKRPAFHGSPTTWLGQHQPLAKANRRRCLECHQETWCDACHAQFKENS